MVSKIKIKVIGIFCVMIYKDLIYIWLYLEIVKIGGRNMIILNIVF